jgi:hypothetical protein
VQGLYKPLYYACCIFYEFIKASLELILSILDKTHKLTMQCSGAETFIHLTNIKHVEVSVCHSHGMARGEFRTLL